MRITFASRGSQLALLQAKEAMAAVARTTPGLELVVEPTKTSGDAFRGALEAAPQKGIFVKEIDELVLSGAVDAGIHSLKDVPTDLPPGLAIVTVLERHFPGDLLFAPYALSKLPQGAKVGTSSPRRRAQILRARPDLSIMELRGNVPTRLEKQKRGEVDAAPIAKAAAMRLGVRTGYFELPITEFPHAPGQGAVAIVAKPGTEAAKVLAKADHKKTRAEVEAERGVLAALGGGCATPLGVAARRVGTQIEIVAQLLAKDGTDAVVVRRPVPAERPAQAARVIGEELKKAGGRLLA